MPKVHGIYWEDGKNWCYGHGTRPKYCPDGCVCNYVKTPPLTYPSPKKAAPLYSKFDMIMSLNLELSTELFNSLLNLFSQKEKYNSSNLSCFFEINSSNRKLNSYEKSQLSYSSLSTKNAERNRERFTCSLTAEIMKNPFDLSCGHCYEEDAIREWIKKNGNCPMCRKLFQEKIFV